ncbi:MAG: hypothetical protein GX552_10615 [Chloroflexi bacterium]|jgi:hypothetical protein|nr:hypothetical protein [Chloroflexota bacterium]
MSEKAYSGLSAGIVLIGLGILFLLDIGIWPWILVVIGVASLPASLATRRGWYGWQSFVWLTGLAILFATGYFWPGILILVGASMLFGALTRESEGSPFEQPRQPPTNPYEGSEPDQEQQNPPREE